MLQKKTNGLLIAALALFVVFSMTGCEKLKISHLRANYHFNNANNLYKDSQYRKAIAEYEAALKANPRMVQAYRYLGESYNQLYKPGVDTPLNKDFEKKAIDALKKAYEIEPNSKEILLSLGEMYNKLKMFKEAEGLYLKIFSLEPMNLMNYYVMAEFYKMNRDTDRPEIAKKVDAMYLRRIELEPENPDGYIRYAYFLENNAVGMIGDILAGINRAAEMRNSTLRLDPNNAEIWTGLGINRWAKAYRFPSEVPVEQRIAIAHEGLKALEKAISLDPNYAVPYSWMSVIYKSVLAKAEPDKESRYNAEGDKAAEKFKELYQRANERKKLEEDLKKTK